MKSLVFSFIFLFQILSFANSPFPIDRVLMAKFDCSTPPGDGDYVLLRVYQEKRDDDEEGRSVVFIEKTFLQNQRVVTHTGWFEGYASPVGIALIRSPISGSLSIQENWEGRLDFAQLDLTDLKLNCRSSY